MARAISSPIPQSPLKEKIIRLLSSSGTKENFASLIRGRSTMIERCLKLAIAEAIFPYLVDLLSSISSLAPASTIRLAAFQ